MKILSTVFQFKSLPAGDLGPGLLVVGELAFATAVAPTAAAPAPAAVPATAPSAPTEGKMYEKD